MLEILTILNKVDRVSRVVDPDSFVAAPGIWGAIQSDGSIANCDAASVKYIHKLAMSSASSSVYESHDIEVGRITTMESLGTRVKVDSEGYAGTIAQGDLLFVSYNTTGTSTIGKLRSTTEAGHETGDFEVVARAEEVGTDYLVYKTISPYKVTLT
jgi:hypothetical protein